MPAQQVHITAAQLEATEEAIAYYGDDIVEAAYGREACPLRVWRMLLDAGLAKVDEGGVVTRYARFEDEGLWAVEIPRPNASRWLRLTLGNGSRLMLPRATLVVDEYYGYEAGDRIVYGDGNVDNCRPENLRVAPAPDPSQLGLPWERWLWRGRRLREAWGAVA